MATTQLMSVVNNTGGMIVVDFLEDEKHDAKIDVNHSREFYYPAIPWCVDQQAFEAKGLTIRAGDKVFAIWQYKSDDGEDKVRWSPDGRWRAATASSEIPGYADVGSQISLVVSDHEVRAYKLDWYRK